MSEEEEQFLRMGNSHTDRHHRNTYHAYRAQWALTNEDHSPIGPWVSYYFDGRRYRVTLLAELGMLGDPEYILEAAYMLRHEDGLKDLKVKEAIAWLRKIRTRLEARRVSQR